MLTTAKKSVTRQLSENNRNTVENCRKHRIAKGFERISSTGKTPAEQTYILVPECTWTVQFKMMAHNVQLKMPSKNRR